jgi:hypothetical protein
MPLNVEELKERIEIEIRKISKTTLLCVFENMKNRVQLVLENEGKHIE